MTAAKPKGTAKSKSGPKGKRARKPIPPHIKAAADRAEARAKGKTLDKPKKPIDPKIKKLAAPVVAPEHYKPKDEPKAEARGRGAPTDYDPSYVEQAHKLCLLGATDAEIADFFGVSTRTIYRWKLTHEDFCQALMVGKDFADDRVERSIYQKSTGFTYVEQQAIKIKTSKDTEKVEVVDIEKQALPDTQAALNWLYNRRPDKWRNNSRVEHTGKDGGAIHVADERLKLDLARWIAFKLATAPKTIDLEPVK